jgi:SOS-response transcriptional repressor LexA
MNRKRPREATQYRLLSFIAHSVQDNGYQPSYREIAKHFGWTSLGYIQEMVADLAKRGVVASKGKRALSFDWKSYLRPLPKQGSTATASRKKPNALA